MLIGQGHDWREGLESAWDALDALETEDVCRNALVEYDDTTGQYVLPFYNEKLYVSMTQRDILGWSGIAEEALRELPHYAVLCALWYLIQARDIHPTGMLINPGEVGGGMIFREGAHQLPLERIIEKYGRSPAGLIERGIELGGEPVEYADAAVRVFPFPKVPVVVLLWRADDEFPARADVLFDSTCSEHLPTDILWATAMMSILVM